MSCHIISWRHSAFFLASCGVVQDEGKRKFDLCLLTILVALLMYLSSFYVVLFDGFTVRYVYRCMSVGYIFMFMILPAS